MDQFKMIWVFLTNKVRFFAHHWNTYVMSLIYISSHPTVFIHAWLIDWLIFLLSVCLFIALGQLKLKGFYVEWKDIADVWLYWDDVKSRIIRNFGEKIGLSSGIILQRHTAKNSYSVININRCYITCTCKNFGRFTCISDIYSVTTLSKAT